MSAPPAVLPRRTCRVTDWRPHDRGGVLLGKCTVQFGAMQISDVPVFVSADGSLSVGTPSMPLVGSDGVQLRDDAGKRRYALCIRFLTNEARQTWQASVLAGLAAAGIGGVNQQFNRETSDEPQATVAKLVRRGAP